jgi:hypothetical protein
MTTHGRPRSTDRYVPTTLSLPLSTTARLERLLAVLHRRESPAVFARDLLLQVIAQEEARLRLPPLQPPALPPEAPRVPGSPADHARTAFVPGPPEEPPPGAPVVPGEGPWLPPPTALQEYFHPPPGRTPDAVLEELLPKPPS